MRLLHLSIASIVAALAGLILLGGMALVSYERMRAAQSEIAELLTLQNRIGDFSVASDSMMLFRADEPLWRAYRAEARSIQERLRVLGEQHPDARKAAHRIGSTLDSVAAVRNELDKQGDDTARRTSNPLGLSSRSQAILGEVAGQGIALDTALDGALREHQRTVARRATWIAGGFAGAAALFGALCVIAFTLIHRRVSRPTSALAATIRDIRGGHENARVEVRGNDELAELAREFNRLADARQSADTYVREQQAELERREHMLAESQRIARVGSWYLDLATGRLDWSDETYRIAGVSPETFTPTTEHFRQLVHPEDVARLDEMERGTIAGEHRHDIEFRLVHPDGTLRRVHERAEIERDADGQPVRLAGTLQDVTEYRQAEERLQQYRRLIESGSDLFCVIDEDYRYVLANDAYAALYQLDQQSIEGLHLLDVLTPAFFEREAKAPIDRCLAGKPQIFEAKRTYPHLGERQLLIRYHPIPDADGRIRQVGSVVTDMTDLREQEEALREHARLLDIAGRVARLGGWSVDLDSGRIAWSEVVCEIHGVAHPYTPDLEEGIAFYAPEYRDRIRTLFGACARDGMPFDEELQILDASNNRIWVRVAAEPVRDHEGRIRTVQGALQDISATKAADRELERLNQRLANILESITDAFFTLDRHWCFDYVNRAAEHLLERSAEALKGKHVWTEFPAAVGTPIEREYRRAMRDHVTVALEEYYAPLDRWFDIRAYPSEDGLSVYFRDVSERHAMEEQLRQQEEALRNSRDELAEALDTRQRLVNALPAHIALLDTDGNILDVNEQWRHFGRENDNRDSDLGVGRNYFNVCNAATGECAADAQRAATGIRAVLAGSEASFAMEYPCHSPAQKRWFRVMASPIGGERPSGAVVMHVDITERKQAEQELNRLAYEDPLTRLPSRNGFVQVVNQHIAEAGWQANGAVIMLDIEGQRDVNDFHGFDAGDRCLVAIGERLRTESGEQAIVARTGGDEFAVFLPPSEAETPEEQRDRLARVFAQPFAVDAAWVEANAWFGYTELGESWRPVDSLLREAELALFRSRDQGTPHRWTAYTRELDEASHTRIEMTRELRLALERDEFELHFHPKVDLASGRMVSGEALIRWKHPERGLLSPAAFIPIAEQSHLIGPIGDWVVRDACRSLSEWQAAGLGLVRIAVNVSLIQFTVGNFAATVADAIDAYGIDPASLTLEITESVFERESDALLEQLRTIHELGVHLSLDDFGTGYSSLLYLQRYPFDEIKIDQGFVRGMLEDEYSQRIVTTVMSLATALGATVVAEGIETTELRQALLDVGCRIGQGYYFSMPLVAEDFRWLLEKGSALPLAEMGGA